MARYFISTQFVSHGSAAGLDDIPVSGRLAAWAWVFRLADGTNQSMITKRNSQGWAMSVVDVAAVAGGFRFVIERATTDTNYISAAGLVPLRTWKFLGAFFDDAASQKIRLYHGDLSTAVAEVSSYSTSDVGSGAVKADATSNLYVGNIEVATTLMFSGLIQRGGILKPTAEPDTAYFQAIYAATIPTATTNPSVADVLAAKTHELMFDYQDGDVTDRTGNGHNGTVTGATAVELLNKLGLYEGVGAAGRIQGQAVSRSSLY